MPDENGARECWPSGVLASRTDHCPPGGCGALRPGGTPTHLVYSLDVAQGAPHHAVALEAAAKANLQRAAGTGGQQQRSSACSQQHTCSTLQSQWSDCRTAKDAGRPQGSPTHPPTCHTMSPLRTPCTLSTKPKLYHTVLLLVLPYLHAHQRCKQPATTGLGRQVPKQTFCGPGGWQHPHARSDPLLALNMLSMLLPMCCVVCCTTKHTRGMCIPGQLTSAGCWRRAPSGHPKG